MTGEFQLLCKSQFCCNTNINIILIILIIIIIINIIIF